MKKVILLCIVFLIVAVSLAACTNENGLADTGMLDYAAFLELLTANGFSFEEYKLQIPGLLSVPQNVIFIGDEQLAVYEYDSNEAMEIDSGYIGKTGTTIEKPGQFVSITTIHSPHWFKNDLIIVYYVGEDMRIINFLMEALDFFAGRG